MTTTTGIAVHDQNLERQIEKHMGGCMAGFFNLFDRSHLLSGKRLPPPVPSSAAADSSSEPASSVGSPAPSREFKKYQPQPRTTPQASPKSEFRSLARDPVIGDPPKLPLAVSAFEFKEAVKSPWKFSREAPRLSLDSRAVVDAKGGLHPREIRINIAGNSSPGDDDGENQRRSPSVIARLMGLELLPNSTSSVSEPKKQVELRRSASESKSRDYRFFDAPSFLSPVAGKIEMSGERKSDQSANNRNLYCTSNLVNGISNPRAKNQNNQSNQRRLMVERKSYYDTADFFPPELPAKYQQQHHQAVSICGEIERRLRMRGIDEPSKDLETLKHILEALQLKGLLHSASTATTKARQNVFVDRRFSPEAESPIVLMKPGRTGCRSSAISGEPLVSPRRERQARSTVRSPGRAENRSSSPAVRRKGAPLSIETKRRGGETATPRSTHSPAESPKKTRQQRSSSDLTVNRSSRCRRSTVEISQGERVLSGPEDEAFTISESSFCTSSHADDEKWRVEEYREGRNLLERCDKLLHSIAEMTSNSNSNSVELQKPSPVSVLDPSFYKEDESSPSPVKKRAIDFKDQLVMELQDEQWSPSSSRSQLLLSKQQQQLLDHHHRLLHHHDDIDSTSDDSDFSYVSEVLRASIYVPEETDLFLLLEKQSAIRGNANSNSNSNCNSKASFLQRKLIFDTITEILDRARQLPPWKAVSSSGRPTLRQIWAEFQKIQERGPSEDLLEVICGVLKKDLAGDAVNGWGDCPLEMSEAVLDIERLIFKDLISETIRDLAAVAGKNVAPRRKLVF